MLRNFIRANVFRNIVLIIDLDKMMNSQIFIVH
jgi:hypothetical protein